MITSNNIETRRKATAERAVLLCPRCGNCAIHHNDLEVFDRKKGEDMTMSTVVDRRSVNVRSIPSSGTQNPSELDDALSINFWCDDCGDGIALHISHIESQTEIFWTFVAKAVD